ncbi:MAG: hypothetical protein NVS9B1_14060 [Candidatus Dormibacteraceae bacterium]
MANHPDPLRRRSLVAVGIMVLAAAGAVYLVGHQPPGTRSPTPMIAEPSPSSTESVTTPIAPPATAATTADPCLGGAVCALNPAVTQATIASTICVIGWTATVRPPASYTGNLKVQQMAALHLAGAPSDFEEDHRVPLELGGDPTDVRNLSPELRVSAGGGAEVKDRDENAARAAVCSGSKSLVQVQTEFVAKWLSQWPGYRTP